MNQRFGIPEDFPGWIEWHVGEPDQFNQAVLGRMIARLEDDGTALVRLLDTPRRLSNAHDAVHGGALMGFIDTAMFCGSLLILDKMDQHGVTLDCQTQFLGAGKWGNPVDAKVEVVRETGRMIFIRGILSQDANPLCSFTGIIRKFS